ncbi:MAG: hypothetical protein M5U01_12135 [Ardenticatenaceae bacterium]|nr:hypothetical protein [Ardenticatenaceae bacterium]
MAEQVQGVGRLVHQDTAPLAGPGPSPRAQAIVGHGARARDDHVHPLDAPKPPGLDQFPRGADLGAMPLLEVHRQQAPGACGSRDHRVGLGHLDCHWLLDEDVAAGANTIDGDGGVEGMGRHYDGHIRVGIGQHGAVVRIEGAVQFRRPPLAGGDVDIGETHKVYHVGDEGHAVHVEHPGARADDDVSELCFHTSFRSRERSCYVAATQFPGQGERLPWTACSSTGSAG